MKCLTEISAVFDCNVLLQAVANGASPAAACFRLVEKRVVELYVSEETLAELEEVLNRDFIKERFDLSVEAVKEFIGNLRILAKFSPMFRRSFLCRAMLTTSLISI